MLKSSPSFRQTIPASPMRLDILPETPSSPLSFLLDMRLLRASDFVFKEFIGKNIPSYAIISHRWSDDQEVTYQHFIEKRQDFLDGLCEGYGWTKITKAAHITLLCNLEWFWIDTCKQSQGLSCYVNLRDAEREF